MRAVGCCPVRVDALAVCDADDGPMMRSPERAVRREKTDDGAMRCDGAVGWKVDRRDVARGEGEGGAVRAPGGAEDGAMRRRVARDALAALRRRTREGRGGVGGGGTADAERRGARRATTFETYEDFSPVEEPERAMQDVLMTLGGDAGERAWEDRLRVMSVANRLVARHAEVVVANLRPFVVVVTASLDSLRSSVAKTALSLVKAMACHLSGRLDGEVGCVLPSVLRRSAEASFLSAEADEALHVLIEATSPHAVIKTLFHHVKENRRLQSKIALALTYVVERNCESAVFRGRHGRAALDMTLGVLDECVRGGAMDARLYAKRCLASLLDVLGAEELGKPMRKFPELSAIEELNVRY